MEAGNHCELKNQRVLHLGRSRDRDADPDSERIQLLFRFRKIEKHESRRFVGGYFHLL